jgi:hypothetical protein
LPQKLAKDLDDVPLTNIFSKKHYSYKKDACGKNILLSSHICPATMRCWSVDLETGKSWRESAEEVMGPLESQVSSYNYYTKAFSKHYKSLSVDERESGLNQSGQEVGFPSLRQFMLTVERGQRARGFHCLPSDYHLAAEMILKQFEEAREEYYRVKNVTVTPTMFRDILRASHDRGAREQMEADWRITCGDIEVPRGQSLEVRVTTGDEEPPRCFKDKRMRCLSSTPVVVTDAMRGVCMYEQSGSAQIGKSSWRFFVIEFTGVFSRLNRYEKRGLTFFGILGALSSLLACFSSIE